MKCLSSKISRRQKQHPAIQQQMRTWSWELREHLLEQLGTLYSSDVFLLMGFQLLQLAGRIQKPSTPLRRASSTGPSSGRRYTTQIPAAQTRTPRVSGFGKPLPNRRGAPTTPHAIRALQQRRAAALTPGRDRRRSGRMQRETPRDVLRNLSKSEFSML